MYIYIYIHIYIYLCGKLLASDDVVRNVRDDVAWVGKERSYISSLFCEQKTASKSKVVGSTKDVHLQMYHRL